MPFTDTVSQMSGRNSRASNVSGMTGASHSIRSGPPPAGKSNDMFSNAGVLSMLKTSTDTGDIGALSFNQGPSRLPTAPRPSHQRRGHSARPSFSSDLPRGSSHHYPTGTSSKHHYAPSQTSRISDSASFVRRGSLTSMQSMPPSLPPVNTGKAALQMPAPTFDKGARDSRSYSMTSAPAPGQLPRHRSATSLKSAGHEPRHGPRLHPSNIPPMPDNRPPYVYPTRLKRPGYRSPSPALSDLSAQGQPMPQMLPMPHPGRRQAMPMQQRPQPQTYNSYDGLSYGPEAQYLNVRPPPRTMNVSPITAYEQAQFSYRPGPMRSDTGLAMPPMPHPQQHRQQHQAPPPRSGHPGQHYGPPRAGYPPYPAMQLPGHPHQGYRGPPPHPGMAPMAHSMFHNAARMARHLPQRTDTPLTDMSPPSSDPPSSGTTAPTSSSPPTPKDSTQVGVDPLFIDPALTDLPDSSSEPVLPAKYFEFAEGLDRAMDDPDMEVPHPSVPPTGFVQRVRAMLESRAAIEAAAKKDADREGVAATHRPAAQELAAERSIDEEVSYIELHELAANETPRFTIIEEFEAPVELPASPVKVPELSNTPAKPREQQRLTRELVKAELAGTSMVTDSTTQHSPTTTTDIDVHIELKREPSKQTASSRTTDSSKPSAGSTLGTPSIRRQRSTSESAVTASPDQISGIDYALRFSAPIDTTTTTTDETQSRDPFILDADTITLQHQRSKEKVAELQPPAEASEQKRVASSSYAEPPVSPLHPGEDVSRTSAVSPIHTQTLGIDETLRGPTAQQDETTDVDQSTLNVASITADALPPPTPRTPRTYSKSVQLPHSSLTITDTPSSNRFSLPPDLSTVADTTMNTNSDMITDVAVRFSLPNTTITIGKPQIVTIPPSSSPEKPDSPPPKAAARSLGPRSAHRNSVTFADQVAPLNIKKPDPRYDRQSNDQSIGKGKSVIRRPLPTEDSSASSRESTTELRFPTGNGINGRFGSTHLPGLKEESVEDMSISDKHHKRGGSQSQSQQLMLPARIAAVKAMQERRLHESAEKAKARRAARHHNRPLADIRDLPSLNFSRMDLIDKLNEALEIRPAKSMEVVRRRDFSGIYCPSPQRPQSTEPLRERYTSFFSKPEDFSFFDDLDENNDQDEEPAAIEPMPTVEVQEATKLENVEEQQQQGSRPLSPEDFLNVATQVNRLSIPSVSCLSERLTNLIPALQNLHLDSILANDDEVAQTIDDIHHLGNGGRDTVLSSRTSAGFRTLAERAEEIVQHGTHDSVIPGQKLLTNKELPPLPESASADKVSAINSTDGKQSYLSGSVSAPSDLGMPLRPASALTRHKSPATEDEVRQLLPPENNPIARAKRSLVLSSASRPWNQDENYPWAGTEVPVDLSIPSEAHTRDSLTGELHRTGKSTDLTASGEDTTQGIDIGSIMTNLDRSASITTEQATGVSCTGHHLRKQSKRSIIGSISKKIGGLTSRATHHTNDDTTRSVPSPAVRSDTDSNSQPHKPGDRYPTTGLTPPVAMHLDEVRSFFSDNSSERHRRAAQSSHPAGGNGTASFRKRLTGFKTGKAKAVRLDATRGASMDGTGMTSTAYDAGSLINADRLGAATSSSAHTYDGVGMGKAEFRIKRFGEKLRHLFAKSGDLIRSFSGRSKVVRGPGGGARDDWLSDSVYSGT